MEAPAVVTGASFVRALRFVCGIVLLLVVLGLVVVVG